MTTGYHPLARPSAQAIRTPWLVFLFLAVALFYVYHDLASARDGYNPSFDDLAGAVADGSPTRRIALLSLGIFAMVSLIRHRRGGRIRIRGALGWILLGFVVWAFVSLIWAEDKALTLTRLAGFGILCLGAMAIAWRFSLRETILWAFFTSGAYAGIGVLMEVLFGTFRPLASGYRFAGTLHPNSQGINCAVLLLSGIAAADVEKRGRTIFRIGAFVGFGFLVLTASRTAFGAALLAVAVYLGMVCSKRAKLATAYILSIAFCVLLLALGNAFLPDIKSAMMLGRDDSGNDSLNGRTGIWDEISSYIQQRPIQGYGYEGFWTPKHISEISEEEKWGVPNSHSAYVDLLLTLGAVGLIANALLLLAGIIRALHFHKLSRDAAYAYCGTLLAFCVMDGFLESAAAEPSLPMFLSLVVLINLAVMDDSHVHGVGGPAMQGIRT